MKRSTLVVLICLSATTSFAGSETNRLEFNKSGYSIAPLDEPAKSDSYQSLMMFLPASDRFAPNINVQVQHYEGSMDDYCSLTKTQFKEMDFQLLGEKKMNNGAVVFEYSGDSQGRSLHWYSKAVQRAGKVYLVTATATEKQWPTVSSKLKACVESFELEKPSTTAQ